MTITLPPEKYSILANHRELELLLDFPIPRGEVLPFHCVETSKEIDAVLIHRFKVRGETLWNHVFIHELPF